MGKRNRREYHREWARRNQQKRAVYNREYLSRTGKGKVYARRKQLKLYGLDEQGYVDLLEAQGGRCGICGVDSPSPFANFSVDHCHDTGRVRGLLCNKCNRGLGFFQDSLELLGNAAAYLEPSHA